MGQKDKPEGRVESLTEVWVNDTYTIANYPGRIIEIGSQQLQLGVDAFNTIQVRVEDDGSPSQQDAGTFRVIVSTLAAPVALSAIAWGGGELSFNITGPLAPDYVVQVSTDLATWTGLSTNTPSVMPFRFTDTNSGGSRCRFYRVLLGP